MLVNLTPHPIVFEDGFTIPKCDNPPRIQERVVHVGEQFTPNGAMIPIFSKQFEPDSCVLPPKVEGQYYIVPLFIAQVFARLRQDLVVINDPIRDEKGQIIGCRSLARV